MSRPLVLFDCDGTLIDGQHAIVETMRAAFVLHQLAPPNGDSVRRVIGLRQDEAIARLHPGEAHTIAALTSAYRQIMPQLRRRPDHHEPIYPGMRELVEEIAGNGVNLGVVTGKSLVHLRQSLSMHGIDAHFRTLQTPDNAPGKPDPGMVLQAMAETGGRPESTVVVGDTTFDMQMARAAGVTAIGVAWGYHDPCQLEVSGAHHVAQDVADLAALLEGATGWRAERTVS